MCAFQFRIIKHSGVAEGAEAGNDKDGKVVMEDESEKEKKP